MHHFSLGWTGVSAVLASLVVLFAFSCIGAIVGKHRDFRAADPLIGWGIATGFLTIVGVAFPGWLPHAALVLGAASIFAMMLAFRRKELPGGKIFWASVLLAVPWLLLIVSQNVAEWDDFTHWLPNASYLYRFAAFPRTDLPAPISFWPAYPYGLPLWHWLTSLVAGHYVEMAAAMANLLLLISLGGLVMEALDREGGARRGRAIWGMAALAVLLATVGNPSFVRSYALTAYTDSATAVTLAAAGLFGWLLMEQLTEGPADRDRARCLALRFGIAMAALINLKQANLVLLLLLLGGFGLACIRNPDLRWTVWVRWSILALLPAALIYLVWRHYVGTHLPGREFGFLPVEQWRLSEVPVILEAAWDVARKKGGHFGLLIGLTIAAAVCLFRRPGPWGRLSLVTATVFVGYTSFLLFTYVAVFTSDEAFRAASFWRYSTHVGGLGILTLAMGVGALWPRTSMRPSLQKGLVNTGIVLAVVVPILTVTAAKHLVNWPKGDFTTASRVGGEVAEMLPSGSSVTVAARGDSGLAQRIVAYALWHPGEEDRQLRVRGHIPLSTQPLSQEMLAATTTDYLLLLGSAGSLAQDALGDQTSSAVFAKRSESGFNVLRRW